MARKVFAIALVLVAVTIVWAKSSKLIVSWKNPEYSGPKFKKILVIGMSPNPGRRSDFEDALSSLLNKPGQEVIAGNQLLLRPDSKVNLDYIREQIRENKIDGVIVSRLVSVKDSYTYVPGQAWVYPYPYYRSFYGYYGAVWPVVYTPGYTIEDKTVRVETNVYACTPPDGELVWTGTSDTFNPSSASNVIKSLTKLIVAELTKAGLFA
jgi:hypothetical protein